MRHLLLLFVRAPAGGSCVSLRLIPRESLILPSRGANLLQGRGAGGCGSLRPIPGKGLFLRREAQTFCREEAPAAAGVCAPFPGKPYSSVERRKPVAGKRRRRPWEFAPRSRESLILPLRGANPSPGKAPRRRCEFAPHSRESLILPSRGANRLPGKGAGGRGSLRLLPGKALFLRREAQTFHPEKRRRLREFAPRSRESLILPLRGANPAPENPPGAFSEGLRRTPRRRRRRTAGCSRR